MQQLASWPPNRQQEDVGVAGSHQQGQPSVDMAASPAIVDAISGAAGGICALLATYVRLGLAELPGP